MVTKVVELQQPGSGFVKVPVIRIGCAVLPRALDVPQQHRPSLN
jgi:hypothetical protein